MRSNHEFVQALLTSALLLGGSGWAQATAPAATPASAQAATTPAAAIARAEAAHAARDYAAALAAYEQAIALGDHDKGTYFDAACAAALAGDRDRAFALLRLAVERGFESGNSFDWDSDLASLRADPRWVPLRAEFRARNPAIGLSERMVDNALPSATRYFEVRRALAGGMPAPDPKRSAFLQYYGTVASLVGEYDEATARYLTGRAPPPPPAEFTRAEPANHEILARARKTRAVFLNESHGDAQTRAANFTLLAPLRAQGFTHLAVEALFTTPPVPRTADHCADSDPADPQLATRGYPVPATGFYTNEPVFGEILREALRLGFTPVSYDTAYPSQSSAEREASQAANLACVVKDPKVRLLVLAGFGHIEEQPTKRLPEGAMAYRFKQATGIDPLTVNTSDLAKVAPTGLQFAKGPKAPGEAWLLRNAEGAPYGNAGYDLIVYTPAPAHRNDGARSWLELGGARRAVAVDAALCGTQRPCLLQARPDAEGADGVPSDRCVLGAAADTGCRLFLRPGRYRLEAESDTQQVLGTRPLRVR